LQIKSLSKLQVGAILCFSNIVNYYQAVPTENVREHARSWRSCDVTFDTTLSGTCLWLT